jgi:hypothetical protein
MQKILDYPARRCGVGVADEGVVARRCSARMLPILIKSYGSTSLKTGQGFRNHYYFQLGHNMGILGWCEEESQIYYFRSDTTPHKEDNTT